MSDSRDEKLEAMLKSRGLEEASSDLAERIILKAQALPQNRPLSFGGSIRQIFDEFHLPKPAYVLASTLIIGLVLGFSGPLHLTGADDADQDQVQNFLYADEDAL